MFKSFHTIPTILIDTLHLLYTYFTLFVPHFTTAAHLVRSPVSSRGLRSDGLAPQLVDDALLLRHFVADDGHLAKFITEFSHVFTKKTVEGVKGWGGSVQYSTLGTYCCLSDLRFLFMHDHQLTSTVALQYAEVSLLILLCLSTLHRVLTMKDQCILCRFNHPEHSTEK